MKKSSAPPPKDKFTDTARKLGCDEDPKKFDETFGKVVPPKKPEGRTEN